MLKALLQQQRHQPCDGRNRGRSYRTEPGSCGLFGSDSDRNTTSTSPTPMDPLRSPERADPVNRQPLEATAVAGLDPDQGVNRQDTATVAQQPEPVTQRGGIIENR